jgi:membrane protease YdiL (CAAX protease family)
MTIAEQHLLIDTTNLAVLLLGVSFMFGRISTSWRQAASSTGQHGRVDTHWFELPELALALVIILLLYTNVRFPFLRDVKDRPFLQFFAQYGLLPMFLAVLALAGLLRKHDLVCLFGFDRILGRSLLIWTVASFVVISLCTFAAVWFWQTWIRDLLGPLKPQEPLRLLRENPNLLLPTIVNAAIIAPVVEEVLFRGFLYPTLKRYTQPLVAMVVTAAFFAAIHLHLPSLFPLFVLACLLTAVYELCGSLWVPILVHAAFNMANIAFTVFISVTHAR